MKNLLKNKTLVGGLIVAVAGFVAYKMYSKKTAIPYTEPDSVKLNTPSTPKVTKTKQKELQRLKAETSGTLTTKEQKQLEIPTDCQQKYKRMRKRMKSARIGGGKEGMKKWQKSQLGSCYDYYF